MLQQETVANNIVAYQDGITLCKTIIQEIDQELK
jgi:hypothetical protein